jgi:hypothetical protein
MDLITNPKFIKEVEFDIIDLKWSRYWLENGDIVKSMAIPTSIMLTDQIGPDGVPVFAISWNTIVASSTPLDKRGKPSNRLLSLSDLEKHQHQEVSWTKSEEPYSLFRISEGYILKSRVIMNRILLVVDSYDMMGNRNYFANSVIAQVVYREETKSNPGS